MTVATLGANCTLKKAVRSAVHVGLYRSERVDVPKCRYRGAEDGLVRIAFVCAIHGMEEA